MNSRAPRKLLLGLVRDRVVV